MPEARRQAAREALYAEAILAKSGLSVAGALLAGVSEVVAWRQYPAGGVADPDSGAHCYYHAHEPGDGPEHGHFHCFLRPSGADGPFHHLIAVAVDREGRLARLFTVNRWVTGEVWLPAAETIALLPRFDIQLARPDYLVNRWLTAVTRLYADEIANLLIQRDVTLAPILARNGDAALEDRALDVLSERPVSLSQTARELAP
ncbi:MAG: hypothetical protein EXQ89_06995 [Rhodospirillaceae bacterium]|nr:hypothetical protein [Rhodospirillaceae bacterium]